MYGTGRDLLMLNLPLNKGIHNETWAFKCQRLDGPGDLSQRPDINCGSPGMAFKTKKEKSIFLEWSTKVISYNHWILRRDKLNLLVLSHFETELPSDWKQFYFSGLIDNFQ